VTATPSQLGGRKAAIVVTSTGATPPGTATSSKFGNPLAIRANGVLDSKIDVVNTYNVLGVSTNSTALAFGDVPVGAEVQRFVEIAIQVNDLTATALTYALTEGTNFRLDSNPKVNTDGVLPAVTTCFTALNAGGLAAGDHCLLGVFFRPQALPASTVAAPNMSTKLTVTPQSGAGTSLNITGNAIAALRIESPITTAATTVTLDATAAGQVSLVKHVFVRNQIIANASADPPTTGQLNVKLEGTNASDFRIVLNECIGLTVDANDTCAIDLQFAPATAGAKTATLTVSGNPGNAATATIKGTAN